MQKVTYVTKEARLSGVNNYKY